MATRTLSDKVADIKSTYAQFQELLTDPALRDGRDKMTNQQQQAQLRAANVGDVQAYADLIQASLGLNRLVSANDRTALIAAVMANSGSTRFPLPEGDNDNG